jgi:hypothetical protein
MIARTRIVARVRPLAGGMLLAWGAVALVSGGCGTSDLETTYGRQQRPLETASVNGTDVLAGMFADTGYEFLSRRTLISSELKSVDTIVWFPNDLSAPSSDVCEFLNEWLAGRPDRTLVYVGADFDAEASYWRRAALLVPPEDRDEYQARAVQAELHFQSRSRPAADERECSWFTIEPGPSRRVRELAGPWSQGIKAAQANIELADRLVPRDSAQPLLTSGDDVLVSRQPLAAGSPSRLIVVANGSFLLNLPLVNHEHRKLASRLIDAVGSPGRVLFLESGPGPPPIDPEVADNSLWRMFGAWPLNVILLHLTVVGVIFCFARWPIFGRPRIPPTDAASDFGKHVDALGELLRRSKDRKYALDQLADAVPASPPRAGPP